MSNIVDLESKRTEKIVECEHEHTCPHCEFIETTVADFLLSTEKLDVKSEAYIDEVRELIEYVEYITRKQTLLGVVGSLMHEINEE